MKRVWNRLIEIQRSYLPMPRIDFIPVSLIKKRHVKRDLVSWLFSSKEPARFAANPWGTQRIRHAGWRDVVARNEAVA